MNSIHTIMRDLGPLLAMGTLWVIWRLLRRMRGRE